jgi:uncharacterized membrane protein YbhN (UPF0104 family)
MSLKNIPSWLKSKISDDRKNTVQLLFGLLISGSLITYLLQNIDLIKTGALLSEIKWQWLVVCTISTCCMPFFAMCRWLGVVRAQKQGNTVRLSLAIKAQLMANVFNSVLPSKAGEFSKAFYLKDQMGLTQSIGIVVLERLVDLLVLGLLGLWGSCLAKSHWGVISGSMLIVISLTIIIVTAWLRVEQFIPVKNIPKF